MNAWLYPTERVSRLPSPDARPVTENEADAIVETRDDDERKSRPVSPDIETPAETSKADNQAEEATEGTKNGEDTPATDQATETIDTDEKPVTEDVEMKEGGNEMPALPKIKESLSTPDPSVAKGDDIEMASSQAKSHDPIPPTTSAAPSRQPSPPRTQTTTEDKPKATPLQCVRHSICHSASLLSLSFDDAGR